LSSERELKEDADGFFPSPELQNRKMRFYFHENPETDLFSIPAKNTQTRLPFPQEYVEWKLNLKRN